MSNSSVITCCMSDSPNLALRDTINTIRDLFIGVETVHTKVTENRSMCSVRYNRWTPRAGE
jgi:hypothetical protein